jgi:cell division septation protein DedD
MPRVFRLMLFSVPLIMIFGCGSTEQTEESVPPAFPPDTVTTTAQPEEMRLEAKTDTLVTHGVVQHEGTDSVVADSTARFAVQVGAFKEPHNAATMQALVREQYAQPVLNEFNSRNGMYQIRVGKFVTHQDAVTFLRRLLEEHPATYKGSWVVQLGK